MTSDMSEQILYPALVALVCGGASLLGVLTVIEQGPTVESLGVLFLMVMLSLIVSVKVSSIAGGDR